MRSKSAPKPGKLPDMAPPPYARRGGNYERVPDADSVFARLAASLGEPPAPVRPSRSPNPPKR